MSVGFRNFLRHYGHGVALILVLSALGRFLCAYFFHHVYWFTSAWSVLFCVSWFGVHNTSDAEARHRIQLNSGRGGRYGLVRCLLFSVFVFVGSFFVVGRYDASAVPIAVWSVLSVAVAQFFSTIHKSCIFVLSVSIMFGFCLWASPFWLGPWIGEPAFSPWLASSIMAIHPVSQALVIAGKSNLIDPVFYSNTLIGVVEVNLIDPVYGVVLNLTAVSGLIVLSWFRTRRMDLI